MKAILGKFLIAWQRRRFRYGFILMVALSIVILGGILIGRYDVLEDQRRFIGDTIRQTTIFADEGVDDDDVLKFLSIGSGLPSEAIYLTAGEISKAISRPPGASPCDESGICGVPGLIAVAQSGIDPADNVRRLRDGKIDTIVTPLDVAFFAYRGGAMFEQEGAMEHLRVIIPLDSLSLHIIVRQQRDINDISDLKGRIIATDTSYSRLTNMTQHILSLNGVAKDDYKLVHLPFGEAMDQLVMGKIDVLFALDRAPIPVLHEMAINHKLRLLSLDDTVLKPLYSVYPFFRESHISGMIYTGNEDDITTLTIPVAWLTTTLFNERLMEKIGHALLQGRNTRLISSNYLQSADGLALDNSIIPYHRGIKNVFEANKSLLHSPQLAESQE